MELDLMRTLRTLGLVALLFAAPACDDAGTAPPPPPEPVALVLRLSVTDPIGTPIGPTYLRLMLGQLPVDSTTPRIYVKETDFTGRLVLPIGRFLRSPLDSVVIVPMMSDCIAYPGDSLVLPPLDFDANDDTLDATIALPSVIPPATLSPGVLCARGPATNGRGEIQTSLRIDSVRVDSVFGRSDIAFSTSVGGSSGRFAAERRSDSLIAPLPAPPGYGCAGYTVHAALLPGDTLGPAVVTTPDCSLTPSGTLQFRADTTLLRWAWPP